MTLSSYNKNIWCASFMTEALLLKVAIVFVRPAGCEQWPLTQTTCALIRVPSVTVEKIPNQASLIVGKVIDWYDPGN